MKIILSTYNFYPTHKGGTEVYTKGLGRHLRDSGHEILVIAALEESGDIVPAIVHEDTRILAALYTFEGIRVLGIRLKDQSPDDIYSLMNERWTALFTKILGDIGWSDVQYLIMNGLSSVSGLSLNKAVLQLNPKAKSAIIVHTPFVCPKADMINMQSGKRCEVVMTARVCSICMLSDKTKLPYAVSALLAPLLGAAGFLKLSESALFRLKELIKIKFTSLRSLDSNTVAWITFSEDMHQFLNRQSFIMAEKIFVIRHGIDEAIFSKRKNELELSPIHFLYAGRFDETKGIGLLCDSWKKLEDRPEIRQLTIIGDFKGSARGKAIWNKMSERKDCVLLDAMSQEQLADKYRDTHCVIIPSKWIETGPLVFHEAIGCGCDVITSDIGGQGELAGVYEERSFLFQSGCSESLYKVICGYNPARGKRDYKPISQKEHFDRLAQQLYI